MEKLALVGYTKSNLEQGSPLSLHPIPSFSTFLGPHIQKVKFRNVEPTRIIHAGLHDHRQSPEGTM
jgi:hypothetical protein